MSGFLLYGVLFPLAGMLYWHCIHGREEYKIVKRYSRQAAESFARVENVYPRFKL